MKMSEPLTNIVKVYKTESNSTITNATIFKYKTNHFFFKWQIFFEDVNIYRYNEYYQYKQQKKHHFSF